MENHSAKIATNTTVLLFLQLASYLVPFLLLTYLSRALGIVVFGELSLLWAVSAYIGILADFGFYSWATKEASAIRSNTKQLTKLYSAVTLVKTTILLLLLVPIITISSLFSAPLELYIFMWVSIGAQALLPVWLYQGVGKIFGYLVFSALAQTTTAILTIIFVKTPADLVFVTLCSAATWSVILALTYRDLRTHFDVSFEKPELSYLKSVIQNASHIFAANFATSYYVNLPALVVGILSSRAEMAIFMGAQKLIFALQAIITPISAVIFPYSANLAKNDINKANQFSKQLMIYVAVAMLVITTILTSFAQEISTLFWGSEFAGCADVLAIMSIGPMFVALSVVISNHVLIVRGHVATIKKLYFIIAVIATLISYPIVKDYHAVGAGWLYVIVEFAVFAGMVWLAREAKNTESDNGK